MITKSEYKELQQYEADLRRAYKGKYKLPTRKEEDDAVINILLKHEPSFRVNRGCGNCMFRVYERVGRWYFEYREIEKIPVREVTVEGDKVRVRRRRKNETLSA